MNDSRSILNSLDTKFILKEDKAIEEIDVMLKFKHVEENILYKLLFHLFFVHFCIPNYSMNYFLYASSGQILQ